MHGQHTHSSANEKRAQAAYDQGFDALALAVNLKFGPRCDDFDPGCPTCLLWRQLDALDQTLGAAIGRQE